MLVIVVIISILVTVGLLSMNVIGRDTEIADETKRLEQLILAVREQGEMQARDFGLQFYIGGYQFLRYDVRRNLWYRVQDEPLFRARELPPGLEQRLYLEGREVVLKQRPTADEEEEREEKEEKEREKDPKKLPQPPQVFILANGDLTGFELILEREGTEHSATLTGKADGTLEIKSVDEVKK